MVCAVKDTAVYADLCFSSGLGGLILSIIHTVKKYFQKRIHPGDKINNSQAAQVASCKMDGWMDGWQYDVSQFLWTVVKLTLSFMGFCVSFTHKSRLIGLVHGSNRLNNSYCNAGKLNGNVVRWSDYHIWLSFWSWLRDIRCGYFPKSTQRH